MQHTELTNHIKGSFLKKQFLEAFLVQSAYIESLLKLYLDYSFWSKTKDLNENILNVIRKDLGRYSLNNLINFLGKSSLISKEQTKALNLYREKRNKVLHDLIAEMSKSTFEAELKMVCELGNKIIEGKEFEEMARIVDYMEKQKRSKLEENKSIAKSS